MFELTNSKWSSSRVGAEYQAIIPPLMEKYEPKELMRFAYGLPIPVKWIPDDQPNTNNEETIESNDASGSGSVDGLRPLPALSIEPWSATERGGFRLGMYVFGKNFHVLERFVESKDHGRIVGYYYQEFHASGEYRRWLEWQEERCARPMKARKLFGWSYQELISRLSSNVIDGIKDRLIRDGTRYIEGRLPPSRFVFNLKHYVGLSSLVEAVALGQGDRDLLKFPPITNLSYFRPAAVLIENTSYSDLTLQQILDTLNGNTRLSKSKSIELFWDAVWPRLLANGWHSEQPQNNGLRNSKRLVFFAPGTDDVSVNELEKGIDYFDSVIDVLGKVVSEPELIELESDSVQVLDTIQDLDCEEYLAVIQPDDEHLADIQPEEEHLADIQPEEEHLADIQPDVPQKNQDLEMFMVVDASFDRENGGIVKLMELPAYMVEERTGELDVNESRNQENLVPQKMFTIVDTNLDRDNNDEIVKLMELPSFPVSEPFYIVERGINEKDCNNLGNGFGRKSNEPGHEANPVLIRENIKFQGKTPSVNGKHEETVEERIVVDVNCSQMVLYAGPDQSLLSEIPTTDRIGFSGDAEADMLQQLALGTSQRRQSTRSRMLSTKALETLAFGYLSPKKKRKGMEEKTPRRVRGVTAAVSGSGGGARNGENSVDGAFGVVDG
ncbi:hypothetical protein OSB04_022741 [Centaurea solstitialis]|uniref:Uncharacterized protein n=1 Tax=Centaurea solstitialis TaxID=347529 RepID=A0AA38WAD0_9ASTR|nr:hypothetical protein OSB04_022741 [Centaurea solstitialis]